MRSYEAARLINSTTFHPDWLFRATPAGPDDVQVIFYNNTYDSSYPHQADGKYDRAVAIGPSRSFSVRDLNSHGVLHALLKAKAEVQEHEDREFLRVRDIHGDWEAPFHPHRPDGNALWESVKALSGIRGASVR